MVKPSRHKWTFSPDEQTATTVGRRHGKPVVLRVRSGAMHRQKHRFYLSENVVWLTEHVPVAIHRGAEP